ncbi:MAG: glycosyltransferase family 2 protein [Rhizomicrobium sp.]|jgi:glycosyltransferase involved in cell wall biosynthesis
MIPFFSVIIPVFNRADALREALLSVLGQSEQDFEIIVVDDGSTDNPAHVVDGLRDSRIALYRQQNRGGAAARNAGIDKARGQFIAFLDSDDRFLPHHLTAMRYLLENTTDVAGYARMVVDRGQGRTFLKPPRAIGANEHMATYLLCDRGFVPTITLVVGAEQARRVRYDERLRFAQDTDFAIRLYLAGCRFTMADDPGAVWNDIACGNRVSSGRKGARMVEWLEGMKPLIPARAYRGGRGWMIAKGLAPSQPFRAFSLWLSATLRGCYRPRMASLIALQIFSSDAAYRRLADFAVAHFRGAVWSRSDTASPRAEVR